jgi:multidrug efflux pump subunit AcrA (membrane-fusion protein)
VRFVFKILVPVLLLAASLAGAGYLRATKPAVEPLPPEERVWTVRAQAVEFSDQQPTLNLFGDVVAGREVILRPLVAGEIVETSDSLVEGGRFEQGEVLVRIDPFEAETRLDELQAEKREVEARRFELEAMFEGERAMLALDREQLEIAQRDLERYDRLRGTAAASEKTFDDAQMLVAAQRAGLQQRQQTIATLVARLDQQAAIRDRLLVGIRRAERDLANVEVEAPFAGFVTDVSAAVGKRVGEGDPLARLIDEARLEIRFPLGDADFGRLWQDGLIGRDLQARWRLGGSVFTLEAEVARVQATIDAASGGVDVYARITGNPDHAPLRPGAFVEVLLPDRTYQQVVELPLAALYGGSRVYAINATGELSERPVTVLDRRHDTVLVQGDLAAGEPIVTSRIAEVAPGLKVETAPGPSE